MTRDMKIAIGAAVVGAAAEVWVGQAYPLRDPVPLPTRMAFSGAWAFLAVFVAQKLVAPDDKKALP